MLAELTRLDWLTPLLAICGDLSGQWRALGCPLAQWPDARYALAHLKQPIRTRWLILDRERAVFSVRAGVYHLAWHTLARGGIEMLSPAPERPRRRHV